MVEVNGRLVRACATGVADGMQIAIKSAKAAAAQVEAFDRILSNHMLYCTVCDNNNGNCTVHDTTKLLAIEHQKIPLRPKPYEVDNTNPFYRYDPDQCILCGRCVEACQNVEVNETLSINWEDPNARVLWDGGSTIGESSCVSCGHCVTVCPCNALMEKSMLGHAGFLTSLKKSALIGMIEIVKVLNQRPATEAFFRYRRPNMRCGSIASARQKQFVPTAEWAAVSTFGPKIATFSRSRPSTVRQTEYPPA
jgi:formate dehydrogenase major subunit